MAAKELQYHFTGYLQKAVRRSKAAYQEKVRRPVLRQFLKSLRHGDAVWSEADPALQGIAAAKERGVCFGRKRIPMSERFEELAEDWWFGCISAVQAGKELSTPI